MSAQWEYKDFVYSYKPGWSWCKIGSGGYSQAGARIEFWQMSQKYILPELQKWLDNGWEPIGEVGPSGITLHTYKSLAKTPGQAVWTMISTIMTAGVYLLIAADWYAEPREFRVQMRRRLQ